MCVNSSFFKGWFACGSGMVPQQELRISRYSIFPGSSGPFDILFYDVKGDIFGRINFRGVKPHYTGVLRELGQNPCRIISQKWDPSCGFLRRERVS